MTLRTATNDRWITGAIFLACLSLYALGACRTAYVGDSGELTAAVGTLGIPHPSGYPLYVMLGHLWTRLLFMADVALAMSLLSAVCAAGAAAGLYHVARLAGISRAGAALAALLLAVGPSFWSQANIQRVYALNALFVVAATGTMLAWFQDRSPRALVATFLLCGLGAANHTFMAIYAVAAGLFMLSVEPQLLLSPLQTLRRGVTIGLAFIVGLAPYAYLPIRSSMNPRLDWGNPESLQGFLDVVLRRDFWQRAWIEQPADVLTAGTDWAVSLGDESAWIGLGLAMVGLAWGARHRAPVLLPLLVMIGNVAAMSLHGSRSDIFIWHRYYIPSYIMLALLAGYGWHAIAARAAKPWHWVILALPAYLLVTGYSAYDRSRFDFGEDFATMVLDSLPPGANLIATDDNVLFVLIYLHLVEGRRPDVNLILQGVGKADLPPLRFNPETEPLFFTHHPNWDLPALEIVPRGVVYQAWPREQEWPPVIETPSELKLERDQTVPRDYLTQNLIGHFHYTLGFTYEHRDWIRARREFRKAATSAPHNDVLFYNLGLVYARNGFYEEATAAFERSHEINPRHLASTSRAEASIKLEQIQTERERIRAIEAQLRTQIGHAAGEGTELYHQTIAPMLEARGETTAARGHRLRVLELNAR